MQLDIRSLLVVAAHPDDEILMAGGLMHRLAREGIKSHILILAEGITSRSGVRDAGSAHAELLALQNAARKAATEVGAESVELAGFPDNRMDGVDLLDVVKTVESAVSKYSPELLVSHHPDDCNVDHGVAHRACLAATRLLPGGSVRQLWTGEVLSSTDYGSRSLGGFKPRQFVSLSKQDVEAKCRALEAYESELKQWPHPRSRQGIRCLSERRGCQSGCHFAEAFDVEWQMCD